MCVPVCMYVCAHALGGMGVYTGVYQDKVDGCVYTKDKGVGGVEGMCVPVSVHVGNTGGGGVQEQGGGEGGDVCTCVHLVAFETSWQD